MNGWPEYLGWWGAAALLLFWLVGAYNRLVRLRSKVSQTWTEFDAALTRQIEFVQSRVAGRPVDGLLQAAIDQLASLLAATRPRPMEPARMAALATALHVWLSAWRRLYPEEVLHFKADGTVSRPTPLEREFPRPGGPAPAAPIPWPEPSPAAEIARNRFNLSVAQYNAAIGQFPTLLVAWIFGMRPAAPLV